MKIDVKNSKQIVESYRPLILSLAKKFNPNDWDEFIDCGKFLVVEAIIEYDEKKGAFPAFVKNKLNFYFLDEAKKKKPDSLNEKDFCQNEVIENLRDDENFEDELLMNETENFLNDCVKKFSKRDRLFINLRYDKCLSYREIGEILGLKEKTVRNLNYKLIKNLRKDFVDYL